MTLSHCLSRAPTACQPEHSLPYAHLNLFINPFGEISPDVLAEIAQVDVATYVERLGCSDSKYAVQFLGDPGHGKTTHLLAIQKSYPGVPYFHFAEGQRHKAPRGEKLFLDEIQRLSRSQRRRVFRKSRQLVLGTHLDVKTELLREGFSVDTCHVGDSMNANRLWLVLNRRIEMARRGPGKLPHVLHSTAARLLEEHAGNVRAVQQTLYEVLQTLTRIGNV